MIIKDKKNFDLQEEKDYEVAENILQSLFKDKMVKCIKAEEFSPQDCFFSAKTTTNQIIPYDLEIKAIYNTKSRTCVLKTVHCSALIFTFFFQVV